MKKQLSTVALLLFSCVVAAHAGVTVLLEEPHGAFGRMNPTGHAAIYLSRVCAATPLSLRRCHEGEQGVVISRYHRISGHDWIAIPMLPYLYAVDRPNQVPKTASAEDVAALQDAYRRANLEAIVPDAPDGKPPEGDWTQLVGAAYYRNIYAFEIETTEQQDDRLIQMFNSSTNESHFSLLFHNCADFTRHTVDFYYPHAIHRSLVADAGIMTPKQAAMSLVSYGKRHPELQFSSFVIPQVPGTIARSTKVRGVLESLVKSKKYALPLLPLAALHPIVGGSFAVACLEGARFNPGRIAGAADSQPGPAGIAVELQTNRVISLRQGE